MGAEGGGGRVAEGGFECANANRCGSCRSYVPFSHLHNPRRACRRTRDNMIISTRNNCQHTGTTP